MGVLFDQLQVIDKAKGLWAKDPFYTAVADRVELVGGTFFDVGMAHRSSSQRLGAHRAEQHVRGSRDQTCSVLLALSAGPECFDHS